jgi:hypothetical protein
MDGVSILRAEDGDSVLLQKVGFYQPIHMVIQPKRSSELEKPVNQETWIK